MYTYCKHLQATMTLLKPFCCTFCGMNHYSLDKLKIHVSSHLIKYVHAHRRRRKCFFYQKSLTKYGRLRRHLNNHRKLSGKCKNCSISFSSDFDIVTHKRVCTSSGGNTANRSDIKEKPYQCEYCQKWFSCSSHLKEHSRTHTKEKPYQCEYCQKCFAQSYLTRHIRIHTKEKPFPWDFCQKSFTTKSDLQYHIRNHTNEKPYQCEYCQKCFIQSSNLTMHIRTHTKEKPYQCQDCQKWFTRSSHLKRHMKIHTKEKL